MWSALVLGLLALSCAGANRSPTAAREVDCPEPNPLAMYLRGAERQAETDEQRRNVRSALTDLADAPIATLRRRRYADYEGHPGRWDLATVLAHHYVPTAPRSVPQGEELLACAATPEVRALAREMLEGP